MTTVASPSFTVRAVAWDDADAASLRQLQRQAIADRYSRVDSEPGTPPSADDISLFCVAYNKDSVPVGCGGLRRLDESSAEIKRMFVAKEARGTGAAAAVLTFLEQSSKEMGLQRLLLETGDQLSEAIRFYTRSGYTRIPNFGYYKGVETSICMEKRL